MSVSTQGTEKEKESHVGHRPDVQLYHDAVAPEAIGGKVEEMPKNYYMSMKFIGTMTATSLAQICGYVGWVLPANTLSLISAELGVSANTIWLAVAWQMGLTVGFLWVGRLSDIVSACIRPTLNHQLTWCRIVWSTLVLHLRLHHRSDRKHHRRRRSEPEHDPRRELLEWPGRWAATLLQRCHGRAGSDEKMRHVQHICAVHFSSIRRVWAADRKSFLSK